MMTHREEYLEIHSKYVIKELYDMLTDNKDLYINDNNEKSILLQAIYRKVQICLS